MAAPLANFVEQAKRRRLEGVLDFDHAGHRTAYAVRLFDGTPKTESRWIWIEVKTLSMMNWDGIRA